MMKRLFFRQKEKPLRMLWQVEKAGKRSHLIGTAHFFPYSFTKSLTGLLQDARTVIFEGPLDDASTRHIAEYGRQGDHSPSLVEALEPDAVREINKHLERRLNHQNEDSIYHLFHLTRPNYLAHYTAGTRPWATFFFVWQTYLNWPYSVDLEAYHLARQLDKPVHFLETIDEQLAVLDGIPFSRLVRQLNDVRNWPRYADHYVNLFLAGKLEELLALTDQFATRNRPVVGERDALFFARMKQFFETGDAVACLGFPHIPGVRQLFLDEGFCVTQEVE
jgi:hypothetical protein